MSLYSLVTALKKEATEARAMRGGAAEEAEVEGEEEGVENATNVVKLGISLVHALNLPVEEEGTVHLAVVRRRLGMLFFFSTPIFSLILY